MGRYRVTIQEAAKRLGVKEGAIRKRIERGTLRSEKDGDQGGRVYVYVDEPPLEEHEDGAGYDTGHARGYDTGYDASYPAGYDILIRNQQGQIEYLQRQLEVWQEEAKRKDHIIAALTERIPELEPAQEPPDGSVSASEGQGSSPVPPEQEKRSWLARFFGL